MTPAPQASPPPPPRPFRFDRGRAAAELIDPDGDLWPVNAYSDADELNLLAEAAQGAGVLAAERPQARLYVYPMSLVEPEPILAVNLGSGPTLLGHAVQLRQAEAAGPVEYTLRFLTDLCAGANLLAASCHAGSASQPRPPRGHGEGGSR
jgi:hypothetical protein